MKTPSTSPLLEVRQTLVLLTNPRQLESWRDLILQQRTGDPTLVATSYVRLPDGSQLEVQIRYDNTGQGIA